MVVQQNMADGILFSTGTDTSIITYHAVKYKPKMPALTMAFKAWPPQRHNGLGVYWKAKSGA